MHIGDIKVGDTVFLRPEGALGRSSLVDETELKVLVIKLRWGRLDLTAEVVGEIGGVPFVGHAVEVPLRSGHTAVVVRDPAYRRWVVVGSAR